MTDIIVIDESGDLGSHGSTFFVMAAIIIPRTRNLKSAYKIIPKDGKEHKWYNSDEEEIVGLFGKMKECKFKIVYTAINKNEPLSKHPVYGNDLYDLITKNVVNDALSHLNSRDTKIYIDNNRFITKERFEEIVFDSALDLEVNALDVRKRDSMSMPCLQLVDFIAGSVRAMYEYGDTSFSLIEHKTSFARRL